MKLKSPNGKAIVGTYEILFGTALINGYDIKVVKGKIEFEYDGSTDIDWNTQETLQEQFTHTLKNDEVTRSNEGQRLFVDEDGGIWTESQVIKASKK